MSSQGARRSLGWLACALICACANGDDAAGSDFPANPSLDLWCDEHLCDWETRQGAIARVGTWHEGDLAVSFERTPTEITQLLESKHEESVCFLFDTIADAPAEARMSLVLDFNDDGIPDITQQFSALRWRSVPFPVRTPVAYDSLRLSVIKEGTGRAVLAQMRVVPQRDCSGRPLTLGADSICSRDEVCTSGRCEQQRCSSPSQDSE
jgi:hypothetical protein